jgi:ABC-type phosphate/phosphonate transport system substrate-binding protein
MMDLLEKGLTKETGYTIKVKPMEQAGVDESRLLVSTTKALREKKFDFSFMDPYVFIKLRRAGVGVHALATWSLDGKPYDQGCLFVPEASPYKELRDLLGKKIIVVNTNDLELLNFLLYENGVLPPFKEKQFEFAYSVTTYPENSVENAAYVVSSKLAEAAFFKKSDLKLLKMKDKRLGALRPAACTSQLLNFPVVYREGVPGDLVEKMRRTLCKAHKDPVFKEFRIYFAALNAKFVPIEDKDYEAWEKFVDLTDKFGWKAPGK